MRTGSIAGLLAVALSGCGGGSEPADGDAGGVADAGPSIDSGASGDGAPADGPVGDDAGPGAPARIRAMWVWDAAGEVLEDDVAREELLSFAEAPHGDPSARVHRLLFEARAYDKDSRPFTLVTDYLAPANRDALRSFVREAHGRGMEVELLDGQVEWLEEGRQDEPVMLAEAVIDYCLAVEPDERLAGIHLDLEPHLLGATWRENTAAGSDNYNDALQEAFLAIAEAIRTRIDESGLDLTLSFDLGTDYAQYVTDLMEPLGGADSPASYLTIMNYFDETDAYLNGVDGVGGVHDNLARIDLPLLFGVETIGAGFAPDEATFAEEGRAAMEAMLAEVDAATADETRIVGFAIHHWHSWRDLSE